MAEEDRYYQAIEDLVFRDEEPQTIADYIQANKIEDGDAYLKRAKGERFGKIRKKGYIKLGVALVGLLACALTIYLKYDKEIGLTQNLKYGMMAPIAILSFFLATGLVDIVGAPKRKGEIPNV